MCKGALHTQPFVIIQSPGMSLRTVCHVGIAHQHPLPSCPSVSGARFPDAPGAASVTCAPAHCALAHLCGSWYTPTGTAFLLLLLGKPVYFTMV